MPAAVAEVPGTVGETWAEYDARAEGLEVEVIREVVEEGIVVRQVRYVVGTFGGKKTRVAGFFAFREGGSGLPGIVQLHGGGQRAMARTVGYWASQGYAALAVNWGEKVIGEEGDLNTDWAGIAAGFVEPTHHNEVTPGEGTWHSEAHPWNSSWLLYAAAARRGITFLEQAPEADGERVGVTGHSMGGRLTVLTAIDPRVKAASPSVGGSGFLYSDLAGVPGSARRMRADLELY
ncbi:MAG: dienelactone hydrolase family protein, partial [Verrucomicrobiales bacterium]|nr:dienelactone hydrolase family protein [Verrucomicrobiales bacterium]